MNQLTVSLWGDEAFASILAQKNLWDIVTIVARDTSPPLHYMLLHFWMQLFGTSEIAIRTLPMLLFVLLVFVVHKFAEEVFGKKAGVWAFFLTLLNPFLFLYAFEARMYMLLALTSTASMWFFATKRWKLYVLATVAALFTHHFSMFVVIVQVVHYIITNKLWLGTTDPLRLLKEQLKSPFARSLLITIALYAPWLPALYGQTTMVAGDFWLPKPEFINVLGLYANFLAGATRLPIASLVLLAGLLLLSLRGFKKRTDSLLYLWLFLPPLFTYVMSLLGRPIFFDRYLIVCAPAIPILLASQTKKVATYLLLFVTFGLIVINAYSFQHPVKQPFRDVAQFVFDTYGKDKMVINYYTDALHYFELKHYGVNVKIYSPQDPLPFWVGTALIDQNDILGALPNQRSFLVMAGGDVGRVAISGYIEIRRERFHNLYLLWFLKS